MAKQTRKWNPGGAANAFVRVILSDAGTMLGGLTEGEWRRTLDWFGGRCAYTGEELVDGRTDRDHAIPMNRTHCGLHLYGNVLPATRDANRRKASAHFRDFVDDRGRLDRIETFFRSTGYWDRIAGFGDLQRYCEAQYRAINALCRVNRDYLASLLPGSPEENGAENPKRTAVEERGKTLPITLNPPTVEAFRDALLREKCAWIVETYRDGRKTVRRWDASNMSETSNVIGNLRSRPQYRAGAWQRNGIESLRASIRKP